MAMTGHMAKSDIVRSAQPVIAPLVIALTQNFGPLALSG